MPISRRVVATLAASVLLHVSAAAFMRRDSSPPLPAPAPVRLIPVDVEAPLLAEPTPAPIAEPEEPKPAPKASPVVASQHAVAARTTTNTPASVVSTATAAEPGVAAPVTAEAAPAHFVISSAITVAGSAPAPVGNGTAQSAAGPTVLPESRVTVPARLISRSPVVYPSAARASEIETDVRLELVVDTAGRVTAARCTRPVGYGLEDAAVNAVRAYRFSPAQVDGHAVSVRMSWTVQFRLN